jgi:hypothetical protein
MPESRWGPETVERTKQAGRNLRLFVDAWIARYGDKGFLPRIGDVPALAVADLAEIVADWEGPHEWAVAEWRDFPDDGGPMAVTLKTFLYEEDAVAARHLFTPGAFVAHWDDNGAKSCWVPR